VKNSNSIYVRYHTGQYTVHLIKWNGKDWVSYPSVSSEYVSLDVGSNGNPHLASNGYTSWVNTSNPEFSWSSDIVDNQISFQLQVRISTGSYDDSLSKDSGIISSSSTVWQPSNWTLIHGASYYWRVKIEDDSGFPNSWSDYSEETLFMVDLTSPTAPSLVKDGTGDDEDITFSTTQLSANWTSGSDTESGIKRYCYAIGTSTSNADVKDWTYTYSDNVLNTTVYNLSLNIGATYYFLVRAENNAGLLSKIVSSDGINIRSSTLDHYEIIAPTEVVSGQNFTVTINAKNNTNDTIPSISGSLTLQAVLAGNESYTGTGVLGITSADLSNGTVTISYQTYSKAEDIKIKVIDENNITGISDTISVTAGVSSNLNVTANPSSIISGQSALITAAITDIYDNPVTNKIVNFEIIKGSGSLSSSSAITDSNGEATVTFTQDLGKAEVNTIRVSAGSLSKDIDIKVAVLVVADSGGTIVASEDPNTKVTIPPNVINTDLQIFIRLTNDLTDEEKEKIKTATSKLTRGQIISSIVRAFNAMKNDGTEYSSFSDFITVEIPYLDNDDDDIVDGTDISVDELKVLRLNENSNGWEVVADGGINAVDKTKKVVKAEVKHFSVYTVGSAIATDLNEVKVYPNPVNFAEAVRGTIKFDGLSRNPKIQIFDITGKLIKTINPGTSENDGTSGHAEWNGKDENGNRIGRGLYFYIITDNEGNKTRGKFAVIK